MPRSFDTIFMGAAGGSSDSFWIALLGGSDTEEAIGITVDSSDNIFVCGPTASDGAGNTDGLLAKYNTDGTLLWDKTLGGSARDYFYASATDSNGNVYVSGYTASQGVAYYDVLTTKYNSSGAIQWQRILGQTYYDTGDAIAVDSSGNVYVTGRLRNSEQVDHLSLLKYNTSGSLQFQTALNWGGDKGSHGRGIAFDSSGDILICGNNKPSANYSNQFALVKYNSSGALQYNKIFGNQSGGNRQLRGIAIDSSDNIYLSGLGNDHSVITKLNSSLSTQWTRKLTASGQNAYADFYDVVVDGDGNAYACGAYIGSYALLAKYNSSGVLQWQNKLTVGTNQCLFNAITITSLGTPIVTGYVNGDGAGAKDVVVLKLPADGSGHGTYGSMVYASSSLTDAAFTLPTIADRGTGTGSPSGTAATSTLTSADAVLSSELFELS